MCRPVSAFLFQIRDQQYSSFRYLNLYHIKSHYFSVFRPTQAQHLSHFYFDFYLLLK